MKNDKEINNTDKKERKDKKRSFFKGYGDNGDINNFPTRRSTDDEQPVPWTADVAGARRPYRHRARAGRRG